MVPLRSALAGLRTRLASDSARGALARRLGVDARALAALRVALACLLLVDLARRTGSLVAFHTDAGVLPRSLVAEAFPLFSRFSVHALSGGAGFQLFLFALAGLAAFALLVGYHTRLATLLSLLLLVSVHARAPVIINGGDALLRRLLVWGLVLPLGARWSLDADAGRAWFSGTRVTNAAAAALLVQVVLVYFVNALFKSQSPVWGTGDALPYVFRLDQYTWLFGEFLPGHPAVLGALGALWMGLLAASPLLLLTSGWRRLLLVGAFAGAHLSMALTMQLYLFPFVSLAALLPFLPTGVWDRVEAHLPEIGGFVSDATPPGRPFSPDTRRAILTGFVVCALLVAGVWNALALGYVSGPDAVGEHSWRMFAGPPTNDVSVAVEGYTADGERVDPLRGGGYRPTEADRPYPSERWRRYVLVTWRGGGDFDPLGPYLCERWAGESALRNVTVRVTGTAVVLDRPNGARTETIATATC